MASKTPKKRNYKPGPGIERFKFEPFEEDKWDEYLQVLEKTGLYVEAADAVRCNFKEVYTFRQENPWFQAFCDVALERHKAKLIQAAEGRAVDGVSRYMLGGKNRDQVIEVGKEYSDRLMELFLKRADPTFSEKQKVEVTGHVNLAGQFDFKKLSKRARKKLRELLEIIKEDEELSDQERAEADTTGQEP